MATDTFEDSRVAHATKTCPARPEEYEGQLTDGRHFYFRYRNGCADLGIGPDLDTAIEDSDRHHRLTGDEHAGEFTDDHQRNTVFTEMMDRTTRETSGTHDSVNP